MNTVTLDVKEDFVALLHGLNLPINEAARELMTLELYRRGAISSGKAAQLLDMSRWEFIRYASRLGIAFFDMTDEEWQAERSQAEVFMTRAPVVSNSSPLIALTQIGRLELLERLFGKVQVPPGVALETAPSVTLPEWIEPRGLKQTVGPLILGASLGLGESEAISLALETKSPAFDPR